MKAMTKVLFCFLLVGSFSVFATKPLLNPFLDTINRPSSTPQIITSLPTQDITSRRANTLHRERVSSFPTVEKIIKNNPKFISQTNTTRLVVKGQGVAPSFTQSPAQAFALAKRAALVDAYRLLGEKIQGVRVEGQDLIRNMMVKRSQVRTEVNAMISEATVVDTKFKDGLCEVELELVIIGSKWQRNLAHAFAE